jgi:tetratricopeptide (TPR) repeat protein
VKGKAVSEVSLGAYCAEVEELIESGVYDEAIAACRHILGHHPKYIEAYRLLGMSCLEKGEYPEASDLFKRVLSADPENLTARSGLGRVYEEEGSPDEAIWQMERAFELAPYQEAIRNRLRLLYIRRDGIEAPRIKLTRGALGRLYANDELFQQAIAEFRSLLEEDRDLIDIQLALAEALWRDGQEREAAITCQDILEKLPHCLKANLILGEIWFDSGREDEAEALFKIARTLDPENVWSQALFGDRSPLPAETVMIPRLEEAPPPPLEEMPEEELLVEEVAPIAEPLSIIERYESRLADQPGDHETRLALARAYREQGEAEAALERYRRLIKSAALLDEVIADLVGVATERPDDHVTLTLLGDAYMKDGRLQEALEVYQKAMTHI